MHSYSDEFLNAANRENMTNSKAKSLSFKTQEEINTAEDLFVLFSSGGDAADYNEKYNLRTFRLKTAIYSRYLKYCVKNNLNIYRFINEILTEWLDTKHIQEQDKIEREAHDG